MYRINVTSTGKYNNVNRGMRYCLTKKSAKDLINTFADVDCAMSVEKLVRIHRDVFCWTSFDENDSVFDYFFEKGY